MTGKVRHSERLVMMSSVIPSAKYSCSGSPLIFEKGKTAEIETRGISDHGFISSIYFRDPNGYVVELTARKENHDDHLHAGNVKARNILADWTSRFHAE